MQANFTKQSFMKKIILIFVILFSTSFFLFSQNKKMPKKPKLVVGIVVEQMRYDYLFRYWDKFCDDGFKKLINKGAFCKNTHYNYLMTNSSTGYASIVTGTTPAFHGIISDYWFLRLQKRQQYCIDGKKNKYANEGEPKYEKSPANLISSTWSDELKISNFKKSKVISISMKDYGAVLSGGILADAAYWYDNATGNWTSSTYYADSVKSWVKKFNNKSFPDIYLSRTWDTFFHIKDYYESLHDESSYEIGFDAQVSFPYDLAILKEKYGYSILKYTPYGNTYTNDFALFAIIKEYLGRDDYTDFLSINYASTGCISDIFGIRSIEIEDAYIRLDKDIAHLLSSLDDIIGIENVLVYVTSDRGASDNPELLHDINMRGHYFDFKSSVVVLRSYLRALYGPGNWIQTYYDGQIYLNRELIEDSKLSLNEVQQNAANFFVQFSGVSNAIPTSELQKNNFTGGIMEKAQNSYNQERSGDILINLSPGLAVKSEDGRQGSLSARNSGYNDNTHVPLIWYGWKIPPKQIYSRVEITDIAATISFLLNSSLPNTCIGNPILELFDN